MCGNGVVEDGEMCDPVSSCPTAASCKSNDRCMTATLAGNSQACTAKCEMTPVTVCRGGDGCCPSGCTNANDSDCTPPCGNGVLDPGETCDDSSSKKCVSCN